MMPTVFTYTQSPLLFQTNHPPPCVEFIALHTAILDASFAAVMIIMGTRRRHRASKSQCGL